MVMGWTYVRYCHGDGVDILLSLDKVQRASLNSWCGKPVSCPADCVASVPCWLLFMLVIIGQDMERWWRWWCVLPLMMMLPIPAYLELSPVLRAVPGANKTGCFVVVLKKESNMSAFETVQSKLLDLSTDSRLYGSIHNVAMAITVALNASSIDTVSW